MSPKDPSIRIAMQAGREPIEPDMSLQDLAQHVAAQRAAALVTKTVTEAPEAPTVPEQLQAPESSRSRKGGAFGGALKRRIEATDSVAKKAATNEHDINLLEPANLRHELMGGHIGDQVYTLHYGRKDARSVVMTPSEYGDVTFSPRIHARRVGNRVLDNTVERTPSERQARKTEVTEEGLRRQYTKAVERLAILEADETVFTQLLRYMSTPGYARTDQATIDGLMAHAEGVFVQMFEAITANHGLGTERVESLKAALDYRLTASDEKGDYKKSFTNWHDMSLLGQHWTKLKQRAFRNVKSNIATEYKTRFNRELDVA